jgi:hypothetical protein
MGRQQLIDVNIENCLTARHCAATIAMQLHEFVDAGGEIGLAGVFVKVF